MAVNGLSSGVDTAALLTSLDARYAKQSSNLSDVASAATSRTNLGLGSAATLTPAGLAADSAFTGTYGPAAPVVLAQEVRSRLRPAMTPNPFALASDVPTVTVGTTATLTGRIAPPHAGEVTEVGSRGVWNTASGRLTVGGWAGLDFWHTGTAVEIQLFSGVTGVLPIWVFVDGQPISAAQDVTTMGAVTASTDYYLKLTFGAASTRRIEIFTSGVAAWYNVRTAIGDVLAPAARRPVCVFVGDSFWGGSAGSTGLSVSAFLASRFLGVEAYGYGTALGGTGFTIAGSFTVFGSATRVTAAQVASPDLIVYQGSVNDDPNFATVGAAALACFTAHRAAVPSALQVVLGPQPTNATDTVSANRQANNAAIRAAAISAGIAQNVIAYYDEIGHALALPSAWSSATTYSTGDKVTHLGSVWEANNGAATFSGAGATPGAGSASNRWKLSTWGYYGTGRVGSTTGNGTRDTLLYSDNVHPTESAQRAAFTPYTARAIRDALDNFALTGTQRVA